MYPILRFILISVILIASTCCIREDTSGCGGCSNTTLLFDYPGFGDKIHRVNIGIFDKDGLLVESRLIEQSGLDAFCGIKLGLEAGAYTAVCWGNAYDNTQIRGFGTDSRLADGLLTHPNHGSGIPITTNDSLFYAKSVFSVPDNQTYSGAILFKPATIHVRIRITGLESTAPGALPEGYPAVRINNLPPAYNFSMEAVGNGVIYLPDVDVATENKTAVTDCHVLCFPQENEVTIDLLNNAREQKVLYTINMQDFLKQEGIVITDGKELTIPLLITIEESGLDIIFNISKWEENIILPEV